MSRVLCFLQVRGKGPLVGKTPWDVSPAAVRQAYTHELVQQVAIGDEDRVLGLLKVATKNNFKDLKTHQNHIVCFEV